jgi:hypothetical protein
VVKPKILPATRKRIDELRAAYRRGRAWHYATTRAMDEAWESGVTALAATSGPDAQRAMVDRLAASLQPFLCAVPTTAPPAPARKKPAI